jgi:transcriptional regulator with XRE-family HTH domain
MENQQNDRNLIFTDIIRKLMDCHPVTKEKTSQRALSLAIGIKPQTLSLYINGERTPNIEIAYSLANYFGVSIDYLLTGISSDNKAVSDSIGLSEDSINMLRIANNTSKVSHLTDVMPILDRLLSDRDFYVFLEDTVNEAKRVQEIQNMSFEEKEKKYPGINAERYFIWGLMKNIENFITDRLKKIGLNITK